jgi:protease-4
MPAIPLRRPTVLLELDLTHPVTVDSADMLGRLAARGRPQLGPILRALHEAGTDPHVAGIIARIGADLPWATAAELRLGVEAFTSSGKPAVAWAEDLTSAAGATAALTLASAFDEVWLQPGGSLGPLGVAVETTFVRKALDRLRIQPQLGQRHEYKNAANVLTQSSYTDAHREALDQIASSILDDAVGVVAAGRKISPDRVRSLIDTGTLSASRALDAGIVDALGFRDQAYDAARQRVGRPVELLLAERWSPPRRRTPRLPGRARRHVAVVDVRGTIASGRSHASPWSRVAGSDTVSAALRAAARADQVGAVLLRVDSPGGSAVASETIWREVVRTREAGKPVVVSMGSLAASGGYFVACPADVILALPSTLTGSIGVLGGKVVVGELLDGLGITTDRVVHGQHALMGSARQPFTAAQLELLDDELDRIYDDFVAKVAAGRRMALEEVRRIARGRVWTGADALRLGLVDELGGIRRAYRVAQERGDLPDTAPLRPALHVPPVRRLGRPRNTDDPRAAMAVDLPGLTSRLAAALPRSGQVAARSDMRLRP